MRIGATARVVRQGMMKAEVGGYGPLQHSRRYKMVLEPELVRQQRLSREITDTLKAGC
jgi:hypothetical protein